MENMLSVKANWKHASLEHQIKELDTSQDLSRSAITKRAILSAQTVNDWTLVKEKLSDVPRKDIPVPATIQAKLDDEIINILEKIKKKILNDLENSGLKVLQVQYLMQLLYAHYLDELKVKKLNVGKEEKINTKDTSGPDMVKLLVEIILLNRESDAETIDKIKNILIEWRNNL